MTPERPDHSLRRRFVRGRFVRGRFVRGRFVRVYRSTRRQEMYLYVDARADLSRVPQALLDRFGRPVEALSLMLTPDRPLARADAASVLRDIEEEGFYLQMPPAADGGAPGNGSAR